MEGLARNYKSKPSPAPKISTPQSNPAIHQR
jgi:hypothetical protein